MKAFLFRSYKAPLELAEVAVPEVGPHDVLVKVASAGVNKLDDMIRLGEFKAMLKYSMPVVVGSDLCGEIVSVGSAVTTFAVGDVVYGKADILRLGTYAEFVAIDEKDIALKPASLSIDEAASLPLVGLTAWQAIVVRGGVKKGHKVLIHGGAGGVGSIAIQVAKHCGATVATTASARNAEFVSQLGADIVIDYKSQDFSEILSDYDLVLDTQGDETLIKSLKVLRPGGIVLGIKGPPDEKFARASGFNLVLRTLMKLLSSKVNKIAKSLGVRYEFLFVTSSGAQLAELSALVEQGVLRPVLEKVLPFSQTIEAVDQVAHAKISRGKAVVSLVDVAK